MQQKWTNLSSTWKGITINFMAWLKNGADCIKKRSSYNKLLSYVWSRTYLYNEQRQRMILLYSQFRFVSDICTLMHFRAFLTQFFPYCYFPFKCHYNFLLHFRLQKWFRTWTIQSDLKFWLNNFPTIILSDWTFEKWGHSNFDLQRY